MTPDIVHCFLHDAIDLHLDTWRQLASFLNCIVTMKLINETLLSRRVLDCVGESKLERCCEADVLKDGWAQILTDTPHFLRNRFNLTSQRDSRIVSG